MGRPRKPEPEFPQVLQKNAGPSILERKPFDSGNLHGRWMNDYSYVIFSYDDEIARYIEGDDEWHMFYLMDCSKTTRQHLNIVQKAINSQLYQA